MQHLSLPLEKINAESAREKSIRHGHPSTLHLWWARRHLATARAVLFAQLVDDPSAHPDEYPTVETQDAERARLHGLIEAMVVWENTAPSNGVLCKVTSMPKGRDGQEITHRAALWQAVKDEIARSNHGQMPAVLDPFAGGGTIPLEAQRLGLEAHASDLNPVAVLINKALIEIPPKFAGQPPVHPDAPERTWERAEGLAEDVRYYGQWMRDEAFRRIGHLYPKVTGPDGEERTVIAWIWARTVRSPNPANPIEVPLVRSWWLGKKKGKEAWVKASVVDGQVRYEVIRSAGGPTEGTISGGNGFSVADGTPIQNAYIRSEAVAGRMGVHLIAVVADDKRARCYLSPSEVHATAAQVDRPLTVPDQRVPYPNHDVDRLPMYGMSTWADAFTNRQLVAMTTFSDLVAEVRGLVMADAMVASDTVAGPRLEDGGSGPAAYADAIATYLGMLSSKWANISNSLCRWRPDTGKESVGDMFARQAISMSWDYAEANPFSKAAGGWEQTASFMPKMLEALPANDTAGEVSQANAGNRSYANVCISTDPPYYDNIGYSDLSDFFYVWLRRSLASVQSKTVATVLTPKTEELVASPNRHGGKSGAEIYFVHGFNFVFRRIRQAVLLEIPMSIYYAYKQQDSDAGQSSTGWMTLLSGLMLAGWEITATWPVRSELKNRILSQGANALASSIVLACRPRPEDASATTRRQFMASLKRELPSALRAMMQGSVAPVDLAQAAIGPGMSIFSRYSRVRAPDGSDMSVREALMLINATLDEVMDEQEGEFDPETRFAIKWYRTYGWGTESSGTADTLARATGTSPGALERGGIFEAKGGSNCSG